MTNWDDYRLFRHVLSRGAYGLAAEDLGLAMPTVRAAVERLAADMGAALFLHGPDGLVPTAAGLELGVIAERMADAAGAFDRMASGPLDGMAGRVKVTFRFEDLVARRLLMPVFRDLLARWPALTLELIGGVDWPRFKAGAGEIAINSAPSGDPDLDVRRGSTSRVSLHGERRYLESLGISEGDAVAAGAQLVGPISPSRGKSVGVRARTLMSEVGFGFACDDRAMRLAAVRAGLGVGACPDVMAVDFPDIVPILPQMSESRTVWVGINRAHAAVRRITTVRDALVAHLSQYDIGSADGSPEQGAQS